METDAFSGSGFQQESSKVICPGRIPGASNVSLLPTSIATTARGIEIVYNLLIIIFGSVLNLLVILLVFKFKKLRMVSSCTTVQVALANLFAILFKVFPYLVAQATGHWPFGLDFCKLAGLASHVFSSVRTLMVLAFSVDCFSVVFLPFAYSRYRRRAIAVACILVWSISIIFFTIGILPGMNCYMFNSLTMKCSPSPMCSTQCSVLYYFLISVLIIPSTAIPALLFFALYIKGRKIRRNEAAMLGLTENSMSEQDKRAMKTFILLLVGVFVIECTPFVFVKIATVLQLVAGVIIIRLNIGIIFSHLIVAPIIIMRNADVKEAMNIVKKSLLDICFKCCRKK